MRPRARTFPLLLLLLLLLISFYFSAQQGAATREPLVINGASPPKAFLRVPYRYQLEAKGGITPFQWKVSSGWLPAGLSLGPDGVVAGTPKEVGEFSFTVTATDSGKPPHQKTQEFTLEVVEPLVAKWSHPPKVDGQRVTGSIKVSNQTGDDFDLTVIVVAINEIGRATAIGYQRFDLKRSTLDFEIPFSENLPHGTYQVNADAVAEVQATGTIYRSRLAGGKIVMQQGP
ncbi:MAG: Ig domain-containing protein [Acidobacteriota bacterium]|nr:Ig domain-containing protein [Acidobacteriota bacterium]